MIEIIILCSFSIKETIMASFFSTSELKALLQARGLDWKDCLDKECFYDKLSPNSISLGSFKNDPLLLMKVRAFGMRRSLFY